MENTRGNKIARQIQKDLSEIFQGASQEITMGRMITVTVVRMSPDLSFARVYLSIFPSENADAFMENLQNHVKAIRGKLGDRIRHQVRIVPELAFFVDDSLDYARRIDELLNSSK